MAATKAHIKKVKVTSSTQEIYR